MSEPPPPPPQNASVTINPCVVLLCGTHVTGKETLAVSLSNALSCPWLKGEAAQNLANLGARSQSQKDHTSSSYSQVFQRIWLSKMRRLGFLSEPPPSDGDTTAVQRTNSDCVALITCYAIRKPARDAIRNVIHSHKITPLFVILHITKETLSGRTLGAEEPELAERIMGEKVADIEVPLLEEQERDVIMVDSLKDVDALFLEIKREVGRRIDRGNGFGSSGI
ncbi:hypothetical protein B0H66DRAFT_563055 [Apodospora peruviana]|uniref:Uncharacterized protein n=1 Tax=Apodospora peruviana TaxID=516989 RepID=A0AAE0HXN0_9PEZI|nr:hypothetical protein B0H66DRAFT_563055 [Apodospora peruviana]